MCVFWSSQNAESGGWGGGRGGRREVIKNADDRGEGRDGVGGGYRRRPVVKNYLATETDGLM